MTAPRRTAWCAALLGVLVVLAGCGGLPESGPVHHYADTGQDTAQEPAYFSPPGPAPRDSPTAIVKGFMLAMQANPPSTAVARSFLSARARATWKPNEGTLVYGASSVSQGRTGDVTVRLVDAHRLDARGGWINTPPGLTDTLQLHLVREKGQWRIDDPPNALVVIESYFQGKFAPFDLYFYDQTGRVLVPEPVYLPRGEQTATNLVRGLLAGPGRDLADVVRSAFPLGTGLDLSVTVSESGVAEVPLNGDLLKLPPEQLTRAMAELAWTLRQVPGLHRVRITVDGAPVPLPDGRIDVSVDQGRRFAPGQGSLRPPLAISHGRVVTVAGGRSRPVSGPFGDPGFALRSIAADGSLTRLAGVGANGRTVYVGPLGGPGRDSAVTRVLDNGVDVLPPAFDMFGHLWLVDRTAGGAEVHVLKGRRDQVVHVRGLSGEPVAGFALSPDGTRLVAALTGGVTPRLVVTDIVRNAEGAVRRVEPTRQLPVVGGDVGGAVDVAWATPTTVAVLTRSARRGSHVLFLLADGSPGDGSPNIATPVSGTGVELIGSGDSRQPVLVVTSDGQLLQLDGSGQWRRVASSVLAATLPG
ncbi:MAG TPA: LpqB family beta-propeller domain-containing protein [Marmoricola sp.]|nr:LpqB family beta-propeller domain-containing protein [Marmoricola sp.]